MTILVVKTCDGPVYFSSQRRAGEMAAVRMALEQIRRHPNVFELDEPGDDPEAVAKSIESARDPLKAASKLGFG
jgi:hypothetical protein